MTESERDELAILAIRGDSLAAIALSEDCLRQGDEGRAAMWQGQADWLMEQ